MTSEEEYLYKLQGRILASEKLMVAMLLNYAMSTNPADPAGAIDSLERGLKGGLQHAEFEPGEAADMIWETMGQALDVTIGNARDKIQDYVRHKQS